MRKRSFALNVAVALIVAASLGFVTRPFEDWGAVEQGSSEIVVAHCVSTTPDSRVALAHSEKKDVYEDPSFLIDSQIEVVEVLRGGKRQRQSHVLSTVRLRQAEFYLIFSNGEEGRYQATEDYRIIPLGGYFPTNELTNKTFDEQIKFAFKWSSENLDREIRYAQEQKARLIESLR